MARRLLDELVSKGNQEGNHYLKKRDFIRARIFFGIAARANATGIRAYYNLACVYALQNDKKSAIRYLNITIENARKKGYRDFSFLMKEKNLDSLRKEKEFIEMIGKLGLKVK
jgi:tetratricopeptide (TPR) repeat protein